MEKEITTVANLTQLDIAEFLPLAAQVPLRPIVQPYTPEGANRALLELKCVPVRGAKVLTIGDDAGSTVRLDLRWAR
jgi:alcohol dehydrogenase, propanol-preferring